MLIINGNKVRMTRGDSVYLTVEITSTANGEQGEAYEIAADDTLTLTMRKNIRSDRIAMMKIMKGSASFRIAPEDTEGLDTGCYVYDVQLRTADGDVYTVIAPETWVIDGEVTR